MENLDLSSLNLPEKEQKILEAAITVFSQKGFSAATTSEIAKNAGVAEGTIFRYFKTKKDILRGILVQTINLVSTKIVMAPVEKILLENTHKDIRTVFKELMYDRFKLVDSAFPMARVIFTEALLHEDVREAVYQNIISKAVDTIKVFHEQMVKREMIRADISPEAMFRTFLGNMFIFVAQYKFFSDKLPMKNVDQEMDQMLDIVLYGIATPKGS